MEKLTKRDGESPNLVAENIGRLRESFPGVFADGHIDFEALKQTLGEYVDDQEERYSFTWHGKRRARQIAQMPSTGTLLPCREESANWDTTRNIFIEGDNLEVLKLLQKSYHRKVKMIYIDPPYNTGNEFIYPDKWQDNLDTYLRYTGQVNDEGFKLSANAETSGRYHTNWLNMMYPRLKLARNLLRDDGAIFVSIDDHEIHNLRHLMDEIFGPESFVATVIWEKADSPRNSARLFSEDHDYILVYSKDPTWTPNRLPRTEEANSIYSNPDSDSRGPWLPGDPYANKPYSKGQYTITGPTGRKFSPPAGRYWRISEEKLWQLDADGRVWWGPEGGARPSIKRYLSEVGDLVPRTLWRKEDVGSNRTSKNEVRRLLPDKSSFDTPKPLGLLERALQLSTGPDESDAPLVLDFFAGSGTTGEAVMRMNLRDGGRRRFLLVQLPEPALSSDFDTVAEITKARLRAAQQALHGELEEGEKTADIGFRAFELSSSNIKPWDAEFDSIENDLVEAIDNIKADRSEDDVLYELLLKYGLDLAIPSETRDIAGCKVTVIGASALVVCLADDITLEVVSGIAALKDECKPEVMRVVFKDSGFSDDVAKTNAAQILRQAGIDDVKSL